MVEAAELPMYRMSRSRSREVLDAADWDGSTPWFEVRDVPRPSATPHDTASAASIARAAKMARWPGGDWFPSFGSSVQPAGWLPACLPTFVLWVWFEACRVWRLVATRCTFGNKLNRGGGTETFWGFYGDSGENRGGRKEERKKGRTKERKK